MELLPLTQQQLNTMLGAATPGDVNSYVLPVVVTTSERLDRARLRRALELLTVRHPSLRLRVRSADGVFGQVTADDSDDGLRVIETRSGSVPELFRELTATIDVQHGPLWTVALLSTPAEDHLVFAFHHFAADMLSLPILMRDVALLYRAGDEAPQALDSYLDYVRSIPVRAGASDLSAAAAWWLDRPWGAVTRTAQIRPESLSTYGLEEQILQETLPWPSTELRHLERDLVHALALGISRVAGTEIVRLDIGRHGRAVDGTHPGHRRAVGWLAQAVPHFFHPSGTFSREECSRQLDETAAREAGWAEAQHFMCGAGRATTRYLPYAHAAVNVQGLTFREGQQSGIFRLSRHQPAVSFPANRAAHVPVRVTAYTEKGSLFLRFRFLPVFRSPRTPADLVEFVTSALRAGGRR